MTNLITIDPMSILKKQRHEASVQKKIEQTGKTEAYCKECKQTKCIGYFDIHKLSSGRYQERYTCNPCLRKRKKPIDKKGRYKNDPRVKKWVKESGIRHRELLTDTYIKRLCYTQYGIKAKDITQEMIIEKRVAILKLRDKPKKVMWKDKKKAGVYEKKVREELGDAYIKVLIRDHVGYDGGEITQEMIQARREILLARRAKSKAKKAKKEQKKGEKPYIFLTPRELRD